MRRSEEIIKRFARPAARASRGHDIFEIIAALSFALMAFRLYLKGWRTSKWDKPGTGLMVYFWSEPAIRLGGKKRDRSRRDGWQPNNGSYHKSRWFKSIWAAIKFTENKDNW